MDPTTLALTTWESIVDTTLYLLAYRGAPVVAVVAAALLAGWAPVARLRARADDGNGAGGAGLRALAAAALGFVRPLGRAALRRDLAALRHGRDVVVYLTVSHGLTVYYLLLMGPLLGKDVLLSHAIGGAFFALTAGVGLRLAGVRATRLAAEAGSAGTVGRECASANDPAGASDLAGVSDPAGADDPAGASGPVRKEAGGGQSGWPAAVAEAGRALALMALGLVLGAVIAAWGLSGRAAAPVEMVEAPWLAQLVNALLAVAASILLWMWPVENLFVGTYLWKVGLAHAGLVAFFWASTTSPHRLGLYRELWGARVAWRLAVALGVAAVVAGMATALLYRITPLSINYKLIPAQMW